MCKMNAVFMLAIAFMLMAIANAFSIMTPQQIGTLIDSGQLVRAEAVSC